VLGLIAIVAAIAIAGHEPENREREARRTAVRMIALAMIAALAMAATIFVSPKLGPRFYLVPCMLLLAGLLALIDATIATRFAPLVALAVIASLYAAAHTIPLYGRLAKQSDHRLAALEASTPGQQLTVEAFEQLEDTWWYLGDDFRAQNKRDMIATYFGLSSVIWRAYDSTAPLGVSDVRLVPSEPDVLLDGYRGLALDTIDTAFGQAVVRAKHHDQVDLAVEFVGTRPELPRAKILIARWQPSGLVGWSTSIQRTSRSTERTIKMPKTIPSDFDVMIYRVGGEAKLLGKSVGDLHYTPWQAGAYWVLACHPTECFVIAAARQGG